MALLIDGYNLLHASGILGRGMGPGGLERSRLALLNFLAESIAPQDVPGTTVVFDARQGPRGLPRIVAFRGMTVRFAEANADADEVIEHLIRLDTSPRRLTVVSSDHRLHRAARRRKATPIDSDVWYREIIRQRIQRHSAGDEAAQSIRPATEIDVRYWLKRFGLEEPEGEASADSPSAAEGISPVDPEFDSPFPPGYGEDITEDDV